MDDKLDYELRKQRIVNYLEYMTNKDLREIISQIYNISRKREETKLMKEKLDG